MSLTADPIVIGVNVVRIRGEDFEASVLDPPAVQVTGYLNRRDTDRGIVRVALCSFRSLLLDLLALAPTASLSACREVVVSDGAFRRRFRNNSRR